MHVDCDSNARVDTLKQASKVERKGIIQLAGEVTLSGNHPDYEKITRYCCEMGYNSHDIGLMRQQKIDVLIQKILLKQQIFLKA